MFLLQTNFVTIAAKYATFNIMVLLNGVDLRGKQLCIKARITNITEDFFNM